jgi:predicted amidophosphoribosyltransferase
MLGDRFGWFRCEACHRLRWVRDRAWRSPYERGFGVCRECYEEWMRLGHRCPRCWAQVQTNQALAFFPERGRFGHYQCGGALLA